MRDDNPTSTPPSETSFPERPGAGARLGNLNALKHGNYSRIRSALPFPAITPNRVVERVLRQEQRYIERIAASALRVAVQGVFQREAADALTHGLPPPPEPPIRCTPADIERVRTYLDTALARSRAVRAQAEGRIASDHPAIVRANDFADSVEDLIPLLAAHLDRDAHPKLAVANLARLLTPDPNHQENDQVPASLLESIETALATLAESTDPAKKKTETIKSASPQTDALPRVAARLSITAEDATVDPSPGDEPHYPSPDTELPTVG